jgi:putative hydrolase of HD superfamily
MIGWLLHLIFNGLTIERRNNYPRQESIVEIEHLALVLHYLTILYYFLPNSNVNLLKLYRYIFWKSFFTFIYSDINSFVKEQIKQRQYSIYQQLEDLVYQFLASINLPDSLVLDVKEIYKQLLTDDEEKLLKLAKLLTVKKEIEVNSKIYPSVYKDAVKNITQKLNNIDIFLRPEEIEKINFYMDQVKRLKFSYRWNRLKKYYHISVLAHLFIVFSIAYFIGRLKNFSDKDMLELLSRALFHDIPEALTGDIVSPTKKAVPGLEDLIGDIEKDLVNNTLLKDFDFQIKEKLSKWMLNPFDGQI